MKIKICEALMYGKNILGTSEAFEGHDIDDYKVGALCNTKEEFIESINNMCSIKTKRFNECSRKYFVENYSFDATLGNFEKILSN